MPATPAPVTALDLGTLRLTFVPDGVIRKEPESQYPAAPPELWIDHAGYLDEDGHLVMTVGAYLVEAGGHTALIDLGWGLRSHDLAEMTGGRVRGSAVAGALLDNLAALGVQPADVDTVLYSHLHPDHVGWTTHPDGSPVFPAAVSAVTRQEWKYWLNGPGEDAAHLAPDAAQVAAIGGHVRLVDDGESPVPGVSVLLTAGHTPGHASYVVGSPDRRAIVLGDAVHCPVELFDTGLDFHHEVDPAAARAAKRLLVRELRRPGTVVAGGHFPAPAFSRLTGTPPARLAAVAGS